MVLLAWLCLVPLTSAVDQTPGLCIAQWLWAPRFHAAISPCCTLACGPGCLILLDCHTTPHAHHRLLGSDKRVANRGYVLDGWPRTLGSARWAFMQVEPLSEQEKAQLEQVCVFGFVC